MPAAFPVLELASFLLFAVMFALALTVKVWLHAVFTVIDKIVGWVPFAGGWIKSGENHVLSAVNVVVVANRDAMSVLWSGVRWSTREFGIGVRDFADAVQDHWQQLVAVAIPGAFDALYGNLAGKIGGLDRRLDTVAGSVAGVGPAIRKAANDAEAKAIATASDYADTAAARVHEFTVTHVAGAVRGVEADIADAADAAEHYTDRAVAGLRNAEEAALAAAAGAAGAALEAARRELGGNIAAVSSALTVARQALESSIGALAADELAQLRATADTLAAGITAAEAAAEAAATAALGAEAQTLEGAIADARTAASSAVQSARDALEADLGAAATAAAAELHTTATELHKAIDAAEAHAAAIAATLASAEAAATGELSDIYNLPADALRDLLDRLDLTKVAAFGAGLVLTRALINAIAREAGLDSAECRAKNKQICSTPTDGWTDLLGGLAALGIAFNLRELYDLAAPVVRELEPVIEAVAS